jgi:hypothetical protein
VRGRPRYSCRSWVECCEVLDIARVPIEQMKAERDWGSWQEFMIYVGPTLRDLTITATFGQPQFSQRIELQSTRPNYGGERYWFLCPTCRGRRTKLYLAKEAGAFACRTCLGLMYRSQYRDPRYRALLREFWDLLEGPQEKYPFVARSVSSA